MHLTIEGSVPSLKNDKRIVTNRKTNRPYMITGKNVKLWQKDAFLQMIGFRPITVYPVNLRMVFFCKDERRHDLDNMASTVLDTLRDAGKIVDDDYKHVAPITLEFGGIDKQHPRVELTFTSEPLI